VPTPLIYQRTLNQLDGDRLIAGDGRLVSATITSDTSLVGAAVRFVMAMRAGTGWQHICTLTRAAAQITITSESASGLGISFVLDGDLTASLPVSGLGKEATWDLEITPVGGEPITYQGKLTIVASTPTASTGTVQRSVMDQHLLDADPHPQYVTPAELPGLIGGAGAIAYSATAGQSISALRVVCVVGGQFVYADCNTLAHASLPLWFVSAAVDLGALATAYNAGVYTDPSWNWSGESIWLGANGLPTQTPPLDGAFLRSVAEPVNQTTLSFNPGEAILL